jgi:hypothetical protein
MSDPNEDAFDEEWWDTWGPWVIAGALIFVAGAGRWIFV